MKFEIVIHKPHKTITKYANTVNDINMRVGSTLINNGIDKGLAIKCSRWCQTAVDGDSYNTEKFDLYVSKE